MAFQTWLLERLNDAGLDGDVYGEYIEGALDSMKGSTNKEREEALLEILEGYMVRNHQFHMDFESTFVCILRKMNKCVRTCAVRS